MVRSTTRKVVRLVNLEQLVHDEQGVLHEKVRLAVRTHKLVDSCTSEADRLEVFERAKSEYSDARLYAFRMLDENAGIGVDLERVSSIYRMLVFVRAFFDVQEGLIYGRYCARPYAHTYHFLKGGFGDCAVKIFSAP